MRQRQRNDVNDMPLNCATCIALADAQGDCAALSFVASHFGWDSHVASDTLWCCNLTAASDSEIVPDSLTKSGQALSPLIMCHNYRVTKLDLRFTFASGFPRRLWTPTFVTRFSMPLPDLSALTHVEKLFLGDNRFSGPLSQIGAKPRLVHLDIVHNQLTGPITSIAADWPVLTHFLGAGNELTGSLSPLKQIPLQHAFLSKTSFSGTVDVCKVHSTLEVLKISGGSISGPVGALSACTQLWWLDISGELTGNLVALPMDNLIILDLSHNLVTGVLPRSFFV